jgi:hypothetical protein
MPGHRPTAVDLVAHPLTGRRPGWGLVERASTIFNTVRADALNRADSRAVISEAMEKCG